jgi:hypothetical protein
MFLARRSVGHLMGEVRGTAGGCGLEVVLRDEADEAGRQRMVMTPECYPKLVELVERAIRRLDEDAAFTTLPVRYGLRVLARADLPAFGELVAAAVVGAFDQVVAAEILHGTEAAYGRFEAAPNDVGRQNLLVERPDLPALLGLLRNGQRAMAGAESERAGIVGRG